MPALRARLARRQPSRHLIHGAPVAVGFLADDAHELAPPRIRDRACEATVFDHVHDVEVLDVDHLVLANQRQSLLVVIVPPRARHFVVRDSHFAPRSVPVGDPFCRRDFSRSNRASLRSLRPKYFGFATSTRVPSLPRSLPTGLCPDPPRPPAPPAATVGWDVDDETGVEVAIGLPDDRDADGSAGRSRDQRTRTSPTFATNNRPLDRTENPLRVSRNDCRRSLRDFIRGRPSLRPLRFPVCESKKSRQARRESLTDCTNATLGTSPSQARSVVFLAWVMTRRWISLSDSLFPAR